MDQPSTSAKPSDLVKSLGDEAKQSIAQVISKASDDPGQLLSHAKEQGSRLLDTAGERAKDIAGDGKAGAADKIKEAASFVRDTARQMDDKNLGSLSGYVHTAAERLDTFSTSLRDQDIGELVSKAQDFGRRNPGLLFAGAVAAGFILSRFLKASGNRHDGGDDDSYSLKTTTPSPLALDPPSPVAGSGGGR